MSLAEIARQAIGRGDAHGGDRRRIIWGRWAQVQASVLVQASLKTRLYKASESSGLWEIVIEDVLVELALDDDLHLAGEAGQFASG